MIPSSFIISLLYIAQSSPFLSSDINSDIDVIVRWVIVSQSSYFSSFRLSSLPSRHLPFALSVVWSPLVTPLQSSLQGGLSSVSTHILQSLQCWALLHLNVRADEPATPTWHISSAPAKSFYGVRAWWLI